MHEYDKDIGLILGHVDIAKFNELAKLHRENEKNKYLDIVRLLYITLNKVYHLGLNKGPSLDILDIGTGPGYFPYVCSHFGHRVLALDMDKNPMYNDFVALLGIKRKVYKVHALSEIPYWGQRFDLVTAQGIVFNRYDTQDEWGVKEWSFFLRDLYRTHLLDGGHVYLGLNKRKDGRCYNQNVHRFFSMSGALIRDNEVFF